jgi:hypothetical protein
MSAPPRRPFGKLLLLGTVAVLLTGCGLGDYEALLRQNRSHSKGGEDDRKLLGEPLDLPPIPENSTVAPGVTEANVFLRPPKVFRCNPAPKEICWDTYAPKVGKGAGTVIMPGKEKGDQLVKVYGYAGAEGCFIFLAAVTSGFIALDDQERALETAEFKRAVWSAFSAVYIQQRLGKDAAVPMEVKQKKQEEVVPPREGKIVPAAMRFEVWTWEEPESGKADVKVPLEREPARYALYFYQNNMTNVAIIYQTPRSRANDPAIQKEIEASLKSLAIGPDGAGRRYSASKNK